MADVTGTIRDQANERVSFQAKSDARGSRVFIGAPDYRVFVWGIDVTDDVVAIQISHQMDENVSTATVTFANDNEKWVVPNALNLVPLGSIPDELTLPSSEDTPLHLAAAVGTNTVPRRVGQVTPIAFAKQKRDNFIHAISGAKEATTSAFADLLRQFQSSRIFPFIPGRPMLQMGDPIRVFLKNPWAIARSDVNLQGPAPEGAVSVGPPGSQEKWYFGFTGFIAVPTENVEAETNKSNIICMCEDIRRLLRFMRTTTSPNVFNFNAVTDVITARDAKELLKKIAGDAILVNASNAMSAGMTLVNTTPGPTSTSIPGVTSGPGDGPPGVIDFLLFGDTGGIEALGFTVNKKQEGAQLIAGVLGFNRNDRTVALLSGNAGAEIEQALSDLMDKIYPELTEDQVDLYGADWSLGANAEVAPEPNHLYIILPDSAGFAPPGQKGADQFFWPYDFGMRIDYYIEFRSRLDVINEFVKNIESVWYTTPKGDIVVEFPQYDALPFNFKTPWKQILQLRDEYEGFSATEDDRLIKTLTIAQGSPVEGLDSRNFPPINIGRHFNPELAARFGIREQRDSRPFKYGEVHANASLPTLAALWQELANADAYRLEGLTMTPNFRAPIAKPYFFAHRNQIVYAKAIHHQIAWAQVCRTVYDFQYVRHFDPGTGTWEKIGGGFGWHWIQNSGPGGVDPVTGSTGPNRAYVSEKTSDPMADEIDRFLQDIGNREAVIGRPLIPPRDLGRLRQISQDLKGETDPQQQQALANEASLIFGKIQY